MFIDFLFSLRWLWIIVIILTYNIIQKIISLKAHSIDSKNIEMYSKLKFESDPVDDLDNLIKEILDEYQILQLNVKQIDYINSKMEREIIEYVTTNITERLSETLLNKLNIRYNKNYISKLIGTRSYYAVLDFVLAYNNSNNVK